MFEWTISLFNSPLIAAFLGGLLAIIAVILGNKQLRKYKARERIKIQYIAQAKGFEAATILMGTYLEFDANNPKDFSKELAYVSILLEDLEIGKELLTDWNNHLLDKTAYNQLDLIRTAFWARRPDVAVYFEGALHLLAALPNNDVKSFSDILANFEMSKDLKTRQENLVTWFKAIRADFQTRLQEPSYDA